MIVSSIGLLLLHVVKPGEKPAEVTPIPIKSHASWGRLLGASGWRPPRWLIAAQCRLGVQNKALNDELNDESNLVKNLAAQALKGAAGAGSSDRAECPAGDADRRQSYRPSPAPRATYLAGAWSD